MDIYSCMGSLHKHSYDDSASYLHTSFVIAVQQLLLRFDCRPQVAMMPFQKLHAFGLYLSDLNFLICLLLLGYSKMYIVSIVDSRNMYTRLIAYLRFLMVHGCCQCSDLVVCSCYLCCNSGSR